MAAATTILEAPIKAAGDTLDTGMLDETEPNDSSAEPPEKTPVSASTLSWQQRKIYGRRSTELVKSYFRCMYELATHANFLMRCRAMRMVRRPYRVECDAIKNTRHVDRILDECSYRLMLADLDYNRLRKVQVPGLLERLHEQMKIIMSQEDLSSVVVMAKAKYENMFEGATRDKQRGMFAELLKECEFEQNKYEG
ncbi:uncharacterized protein LOC144174390 [Haemaphysalis longicornis]